MRVPILALALCAWIPAACGSGGDDGAEGYRVAVIPKGMTHEFWKTVQAGAEAAGDELGVEVVWDGPGKESDRAEQIKIVEKSIPRVDAIAIAPLDADALTKPLRAAHDAGKPVLVFDSGLRGWDGYVSFVATDNHGAGVRAAQVLAERIGGKGRVLVLRYAVGHESTSQREEGFLEGIAAFPDIEVVSSDQYGGEEKQACKEAAERLMVRYGDVDGCFAPCEPVTIGLMEAIDGVGKRDSIRLVGFDSSEVLKRGLAEGAIDALMLQDPYRMGDLAVRRMLDHLEGRSVDKRVDTGCVVATPENMDEADVARLLYGG